MRLGLALFSALALLVASAVPVLAQEPLVLTNGDWPPYFSPQFKHGGLGSRIVTEAFAEVGIKVRYEYFPWKRAYESAKEGKFAGSVGWRKTPQREKYFYFSDPILIQNAVFFHKRGKHFNWETIEDIGNLTIGATLGYSYIELLRSAVERRGGSLDIISTDAMNLHKLAEGRIDIFPCSEAVGYYLLRTEFLPGTTDLIRHHPRPLYQGNLHLLISRKTPGAKAILNRFNEGLRRLRSCGLYHQYENESLRGEYMPSGVTPAQRP